MNLKNERLKSPFQPASKPQSDLPGKPKQDEIPICDESLTNNINACIDDLKKMALQNKDKRNIH